MRYDAYEVYKSHRQSLDLHCVYPRHLVNVTQNAHMLHVKTLGKCDDSISFRLLIRCAIVLSSFFAFTYNCLLFCRFLNFHNFCQTRNIFRPRIFVFYALSFVLFLFFLCGCSKFSGWVGEIIDKTLMLGKASKSTSM